MTKIRFCINIIIVFLFALATAFFSGNVVLLYVDIASLILAIIVPFIIVSMIFPLSTQRLFLKTVFNKDGSADQGLLKQAVEYCKSYKRILIYSAVIWSIMGAIGIGANLAEPEALGMNFGVLMIVPLYTSFFLLVVIEPLRASAVNKILQKQQD